MILALIPAYNEEKTIANVIKETFKYVDKIIVIDDGSSDKTSEIANKFGAMVLNHKKNFGVGAAMCTGINFAKKLQPDIVITIDADGQHDPNEIPKLIKPIMLGKADFTIGSRFLSGKPNMSSIKLFGNKLLSLFVSILIGSKITDAQCGFRALNYKALMDLNLEASHTYVQAMIIELCLKKHRLIEIPIKVRKRMYDKSKVTSNLFKYITKTICIILKTYIRVLFKK